MLDFQNDAIDTDTVHAIEGHIMHGLGECKSVTEIAQDIAALLARMQNSAPENA